MHLIPIATSNSMPIPYVSAEVPEQGFGESDKSVIDLNLISTATSSGDKFGVVMLRA